jgi:hypothetical protein
MWITGFVLGAGIFTHIRYAAFYVALLSMTTAGSQDIWMAAVIGIVYGVIAGGMPLSRLARADSPGSTPHPLFSSTGIRATQIIASIIVICGILMLAHA